MEDHEVKKVMLSIMAFVLLLSGCNKQNEEQSQEEVQEEKVVIEENDLYKASENPTNEYAKVFNELSKAVKQGNDEKEAEYAAVCFAYDFFDLSTKTSSDDIGGLTFVPNYKVEEFKEYANTFYYVNYDLITNQYSKESLPYITGHEVTKMTAGNFMLDGISFSGYEISIQLQYKESQLDPSQLKQNVTLQVVAMDDSDYDEYVAYYEELAKQNYTAPAPDKTGRYRVISAK